MTTTAEAVYAKCADCDVDLADRDAVSAHGRKTMAPTGEQGVVARGHRVNIVNPTDEERRAGRVRWAIGDALERLYERLHEAVERNEFTAADVKAEMWAFDLADGWDDYAAEAQDG